MRSSTAISPKKSPFSSTATVISPWATRFLIATRPERMMNMSSPSSPSLKRTVPLGKRLMKRAKASFSAALIVRPRSLAESGRPLAGAQMLGQLEERRDPRAVGLGVAARRLVQQHGAQARGPRARPRRRGTGPPRAARSSASAPSAREGQQEQARIRLLDPLDRRVQDRVEGAEQAEALEQRARPCRSRSRRPPAAAPPAQKRTSALAHAGEARPPRCSAGRAALQVQERRVRRGRERDPGDARGRG